MLITWQANIWSLLARSSCADRIVWRSCRLGYLLMFLIWFGHTCTFLCGQHSDGWTVTAKTEPTAYTYSQRRQQFKPHGFTTPAYSKRKEPAYRVPSYMLELHQRHQQSWNDFERFNPNHFVVHNGPQAVNANSYLKSLGQVTRIQQHKYISSAQPNIIGSHRNQYLMSSERSYPMTMSQYSYDNNIFNFLLTPQSNNQQLVDAQLRLRLKLPPKSIKNCRDTPINIKVAISSINDISHNQKLAVFEPDPSSNCTNLSGWLVIPIERRYLEQQLKPLIFRPNSKSKPSLKIALRMENGSQLVHSMYDPVISEENRMPQLLTFHRSSDAPKRSRRQKRSTVKSSVPSNHNEPDFGNVASATKNPRGYKYQSRKPISTTPYARRQRTSRKNRKSNKHLRYVTKTNLERNCQRRDFMVNLNKIGWLNEVLAPKIYNAGYCWGHCPFPLSSHYNVTNHAVVMHLIHTRHIANIRQPCCVPYELEPLGIMYFDKDQSVVFHRFDNMAVLSCSCR